MIRAAAPADADPLCRIYNWYVTDTVVTFEEQRVSAPEMAQRIADTSASWPWLVAEIGERLVGYAYASAWKERSAYRHTVETTIYIDRAQTRRGFGSKLYSALIDELKQRRFHRAIGVIALPNPASVAFHERLGFIRIGEMSEVGRKHDRWIDVGYWQLSL